MTTGSVTPGGLLQGIVPTPPRSSGNDQKDLAALTDWTWQLYQVVALQETFVTTASQINNNFDPATLPNPSTSNTATAQGTANSAYVLANDAEERSILAQSLANTAQLTANTAVANSATAQTTANTANDRTKNWAHGSLTITDASTNEVATLAVAQADTAYDVLVTPAGTSGIPPDGAYLVTDISKTNADFTVTIKAAPGVGNSVTFNYLLVRF